MKAYKLANPEDFDDIPEYLQGWQQAFDPITNTDAWVVAGQVALVLEEGEDPHNPVFDAPEELSWFNGVQTDFETALLEYDSWLDKLPSITLIPKGG